MSEIDQARAALRANPFPASPWVQISDDAILIKAGYSETIQRMLRWVPKVQWIPSRRVWVVPLTGAELIRSVLPELSRLAEATHEDEPGRPADSVVSPSADPARDPRTSPLFLASAEEREWFRNAARFLYGTDWQRDTARALGRDEANLACWLVGEAVAEDDPSVLLGEMLELMRRRAGAITIAADELEAALATRTGNVPATGR